MTRIAWVCLCVGLLACGVAIWNKINAERARKAAEQAIDIAERAIETAKSAGLVAQAEHQAQLYCQARGRPIQGFQVHYADGRPARVAVLCSSELTL